MTKRLSFATPRPGRRTKGELAHILFLESYANSDIHSLRTYTLYITYSAYYRTPRVYLSGYSATTNTPLPPMSMMDDIVGDYKDKTVTLEDFAFTSPPIKTASVHPCRHASVMKVLLDRADAALKLRMEKLRSGQKPSEAGMEGLVDQTAMLNVSGKPSSPAKPAQVNSQGGDSEWEVLPDDGQQPEEVAIRVDQYLVVFLKFMASVTPGIEHDFTMGMYLHFHFLFHDSLTHFTRRLTTPGPQQQH